MSRKSCLNCLKEIKIQIFKDTDWCSENCRKALANEEDKPQAQTDAGVINNVKR